MAITKEALVRHYPFLYHMAHKDSWPSIARYGLLSTTALLDLFEIGGEERHMIESCHRPQSVPIHHPKYGTAIIRDQLPMREAVLKKCLVGCAPTKWYRILNARVFFWLTKKRVETLLSARAYRDDNQLVVTVDTNALLDKYEPRVELSPINSGSTIYRAVKRGPGTFHGLNSYPFVERRKARGLGDAVAELAVRDCVPDIRNLIVRVDIRRGAEVLSTIYESNLTD